MLAACSVIGAPYLFAEYYLRQHGPLVAPPGTQPASGRWYDDYFVIETIGEGTYAIGEPRYYQGNYSYLIVGTQRAILFDAGSGNGDIVPVVRSLTGLPVTVVPSHLHFDHVGALGRLDRTAFLDDADLRKRAVNGSITLERYEFLGFADGLSEPTVRVDEWWRAGTIIDLGERRLTVLRTPGHTPTSMSLYDSEHRLLFCGDFVYPGMLYAFLPGASRSQYARTAEFLLQTIEPSTLILAAHPDDRGKVLTAPRLAVTDLRALRASLSAIAAGDARSSGFYPRSFPINAAMNFATGFPWNNR